MLKKVQSILFNNETYTIKSSLWWLKKHKIKPIKKPHVTTNYIRYRLHKPSKFKRFYTMDVKKDIKFIIGLY